MFPATWKGTLVWSGTTALATWLASAPAVVAPGETPFAPLPARVAAADTQAVVVQMQELNDEAERLARRLSEVEGFTEPERDPFRFRRVPVAPAPPPVLVVPEVSAAPAPLVVPPPFALSGIAEERLGDTLVRTAVITGAGDLWLVKAGEKVEGKFEVTAVEADAVELIRADTGTAIRLTFSL